MDKKQPLGNTELRAMIVIGALLAVIGLFVWLANADTGSGSLTSGADESSPTGQFLGSAIGLLGLMLLSLGWGAAAICRQIVNSARQLRSNASTSTANWSITSAPS